MGYSKITRWVSNMEENQVQKKGFINRLFSKKTKMGDSDDKLIKP